MPVVTTSSSRGLRLAFPSVSGLLALAFAAESALPAQIHWSERQTLSARRRYGMAFDETRGRAVLLGGNQSRGTAQTNTLNDTWEWDGASWSKRSPVISPSLTDLARAMVYDTINRRVLAFNFSASGSGETWRWDGRIWVRISTPVVPTARNHYAAAFDEVRGRLVMFGGSTSSGGQQDVWEFNGTNWAAIGASGPTVRNDPAMAWDGVRQRVILFGGRTTDAVPTSLNDTWEWDGTAWTRMSPTTVPPVRNSHAMVWNPVRNRVLMFGGGTAIPGTILNDTWEWDGTNWARVTTATTPPGRANHSMAFDTIRGLAIMSAGESATDLRADTWTFNGTDWIETSPEPAPFARSEHGAAFDEARRHLVVFGGRNAQLAALGDTWLWRDAQWVPVTPANSPSARFDHAMVYDTVRQQVVLFGGTVGTAPQNDTWLWNGTTWTLANPATRPSARANHAMAWDSVRNRIVLFGGATPIAQSDTWEWDGTTWAQITTATSPPARSEHALGYDPINQRTVLSAGKSATNLYLQDTWLYDGTNWATAAQGNVPTTRSNHSIALDARRNRLLLFGGGAGTATRGDTLEWSGSTWINQTVFPAPLGRQSHTLTAETAQRRILLFGGENTLGRRAETWIISSAAAGRIDAVANTGCAGSGASTPATMEGFGVPFIGNSSFALDLYTATPVTTPLPVFFFLSAAQGTAALPGCPLAVDPSTLFLTGYRLQLTNFASMPIPIPSNLSLLGATFIAQALHVAPPTNLNGLAASGGYRITIGDL